MSLSLAWLGNASPLSKSIIRGLSDSAFTAEILIDICRKKVPTKVLLMDQKVIGGLGNAYTDGILWVAKMEHTTESLR